MSAPSNPMTADKPMTISEEQRGRLKAEREWLADFLEWQDYVGTGNTASGESERQEAYEHRDALFGAIDTLLAALDAKEAALREAVEVLRPLMRLSAIVDDQLDAYAANIDHEVWTGWRSAIDAASSLLARDTPDPINEVQPNTETEDG